MSTQIGQLTFDGSDAENESLRPFAEQVQSVVGTRIEPVTVLVRQRFEMPRYRDARPGDKPGDGNARGYWRARRRVILLAADLFADRGPLDETLGHEIVHVMFTDGIADKGAMLPLLIPAPENFADQVVFGRDRGYAGTPEECLAVWGSAALFGFDPPAYVSLFKRSVARPDLPALRRILLGPEPIPDEPPPDLSARVAQLEAVLAEVAAGAFEEAAALTSLGNKAQSGIGGGT